MRARQVVEGFCLPATGELIEHEAAWVGFIRAISRDTDPAPSLVAVQALRRALEAHLGSV